jgi:hypothetical protein
VSTFDEDAIVNLVEPNADWAAQGWDDYPLDYIAEIFERDIDYLDHEDYLG